MKIAIIGAGLTGLTAGSLLQDYADIRVFEKNKTGGLVSSYCKGYCIEKFYHHCFKFDDDLIETIRKFNLSSKLVWRVARTGFAVKGKIYPLNTPFEILRYPYLSIVEELKLALFTLRSKKKNYEEFDDMGVVEGIRSELGDSLLNKFFMPLLRSKFGENASDVSYAWMLARVAIRSNRKYGGEEIGYLRHGFQQLIDRMSEDLEITYGKAKISKSGSWEVNGEKFDAVIYTAPLPELGELASKLKLPEIKYQSSVCALLGCERSLTENIYWTNIADELSFGAVIEHTNFMPIEDYGEHLIYLASYSTPDGWLFNLDNEEITKLFLSDLERLGMKKEDVKWTEIFKAKYSGPIYEKGYLRKITPYKISGGFFIAGMTSKSNYPERSMNGSIKAGKEVAEVIKREYFQ
jgi:protoporphyrinogen oxidase